MKHIPLILITFLVLVNQSFGQAPSVRYNKTTGAVTEPSTFWSARRVIPCPAMSPAHQINVTKYDQKETLTADTTLTLSATPAANTWFGWTLAGDATSSRKVTLPAGTWISENFGGVITDFMVKKGANVTSTILASYDGTNYHIYGDPVPGTAIATYKTGVNYTIGTEDPAELYGGIIYVTAACTLTVPAIKANMNFTVISEGAFAVSVDVNASDKIVRDGVVQADGEKITSPGAVNDMAVFTYHDVDGFYAVTNAWTNGG